EHGIVTSRGGDTSIADLAPLGSRLRILPIHACPTARMHDSYGVVDAGGEIVERWRRMRGWRYLATHINSGKETAMSLSDELSKLAALRASGTLSEEEFTRAKERLLNAQPAAAQEPMSAAVNSFRRSRTDRWLGGV